MLVGIRWEVIYNRVCAALCLRRDLAPIGVYVKHSIAFAVVLGVFIAIACIFNSANAQGTNYPAAVGSATPTLTPTPCIGAPAEVTLLAPAKGKTLTQQQVTLRWTKVDCVTKYRFVIRRGSKTGPLEQKGGTTKRQITTHTLSSNKYFWRIRSCNGTQCTKTEFWTFTVTAPNPPPSGGGDGVPPILPPPHDNLVPHNGGFPNGAYIGTSSGTRYYFDCGIGWAHIGGGMLYFTVLGFQGYQKVTVGYQLIPADTSFHYVTTLTSDQYGRVLWSRNTAGDTPSHYHWIFDSSTASYCGHYDR